MKENIIRDKSYTFALRIMHLHLFLNNEKKLFHLSGQLFKSGTSIGANVEEAIGAESRRDFIHKLSVSYKEARETRFWLKLIRDTEILPEAQVTSMLDDCEELLAIIGKILITTKGRS